MDVNRSVSIIVSYVQGNMPRGEPIFTKLNDSVISVICLKAGSITQACRTADERHFYIAHNSAALLFLSRHFPHERELTPPYKAQLALIAWKIIICAGKKKKKKQGSSFVLIYSIQTL